MTFVNVYVVMIDSHTSSRGWAEFFALITSVLFVLNSFCLTTIINNAKKTYLYTALICYLLTGIRYDKGTSFTKLKGHRLHFLKTNFL